MEKQMQFVIRNAKSKFPSYSGSFWEEVCVYVIH